MRVSRSFSCLAVLFLLATASLLATQGNLLKPSTFRGLELRGIGPALMAGRVADIAIHPRHQATWYVAVGSGGVWKTVNAGTTWTPIFEHEGSYSVGCVTIDPTNPEVVWVGTGENVSGRHVGYGDGVYRSLDGGKTWKNMGLKASEHISKILVDPRDSRVLWVAAEGPLWASGGERGVFKSVDGGRTWTQVLEISQDTGVTDLEMDPRHPDILYAAAYMRRRHVWGLLAGGPESGIYKSTDGGAHWRKLTRGLPTGDLGKIGIAVSPVDPDIVYATIEARGERGGFYRSADSGESWEKRSGYRSGGTGPHYYQEIYASPFKLDRVYQMDVWIHISEDGGRTFRKLGEKYKHSDNHALAFFPGQPDHLLAGCDGGLYETFDHARTWRFVANLPVTQIYKLALDNDKPFYNIVGGTQDNNTQVGPSRTLNLHGIRNSDWYNTIGGDGYACQIDPKDPNIIYSEWQIGGLMRYDRRSRELVDIKPQPAAGDPPERWNWDAPILVSPHSHTRLYYGSQRLWRSEDRGDSWTPVSGDLTRGRNRYRLKMMGRVWSVDALYDNGAMSWYATLTSISESPRVEGLIYVGTDDGLIQVTEDGGRHWRRVESLPGVPEFAFVNEVKASVADPDTVFAVLDNHKVGDFTPYLVKSTDRGRTWTSIRGDLPDRTLLWSIVQDQVRPDLLFLGTEFGIRFTLDGGGHWVRLEGGVPTIPFRDLEIQRRETDLVGASFGRGFYILDDYSPLREVSARMLEEPAHLFQPRQAPLYIPANLLGLREKANQGDAYFEAPNPPFGAVFTYYLKKTLTTDREKRQKNETKLREKGEDVPFPGLARLERESREEKPVVVLTVRDAAGRVVRRVEGPVSAGFHRVAWDLRYPPFEPAEIEPPKDLTLWDTPPRGPLVAPGRYTVTLSQWAAGRQKQLSKPRSFQVVLLENSTLERQDPKAILTFQARVGELERQALGSQKALREGLRRLRYIRKALLDTPGAGRDWRKRVLTLENRLKDLDKQLSGDPTLGRLWEPRTPSILERVNQIVGALWNTTYGPTRTQRQSYQVAAARYRKVGQSLKKVLEVELKGLEKEMEAAHAPWTPGRVPR